MKTLKIEKKVLGYDIDESQHDCFDNHGRSLQHKSNMRSTSCASQISIVFTLPRG